MDGLFYFLLSVVFFQNAGGTPWGCWRVYRGIKRRKWTFAYGNWLLKKVKGLCSKKEETTEQDKAKVILARAFPIYLCLLEKRRYVIIISYYIQRGAKNE